MTIPDYDEGQFPHPKEPEMSEQGVREVQDSRREVERLTRECGNLDDMNNRQAGMIVGLTREIGEWKELAHSQQKAFAELLGERNAAVERFQSVSEDRSAVARERDAAIELARRMRDWISPLVRGSEDGAKLVVEFDRLHGTAISTAGRDPVACDPPTCSHETAPDGTCHRCGTVTREVPLDRPTGETGWFYRENSDAACLWQIGNRTLDEWVETIGGGWITLTFLRQCERAPHPAGPWEPCPKGGV